MKTSENIGDSRSESALRQMDPAVADLVQAELRRQQDNLELIASENFTPGRCSKRWEAS